MTGDRRRALLELELGIVRDLYNGEKSRRETVRASLTIPFAAVAFIVISIGTLVRLFQPSGGHVATGIAGWAALAAALLAFGLLGQALVLIYRLDYAAIDTDTFPLDILDQAESVEGELAPLYADPAQRRAEAEFVALRGAIAAFTAGLANLRRRNAANLVLQGRILRTLVLCVGAVVTAAGLALVDAILH